MAASYPGAIKSFTAKTDDVDDVMAVDVNELQEEIAALETELGADVAGTATNLLTRLAASLDGAGFINLAAATTLTISSGSVTSTQNYHLVDTESSAASDDLNTVTAAAAGGFMLFIRPVASARNVVVKHNVGNILCMGAQDITLDLNSDFAVLIYDAVLTKWIAWGVGAGLLGSANTWAGKQTFLGGVSFPTTVVTADTTLGNSHQAVGVNCNGANKTITLPNATGCTGTQYDILKIDAGAYTVTIAVDNPADSINGAATYVLSNQWSGVTLRGTGTGWWII